MFAATAFLAGATVWQLGRFDGSDADFTLRWRSWEYGWETAEEVRVSPDVDHARATFRCRVRPGDDLVRVAVPYELAPLPRTVWMRDDETVRALELVWTESDAADRTLEAAFVGCQNPGDDRNGLAVSLDGAPIALATVPRRMGKGAPPFMLRVPFRSKKGENRLELRNVSPHKHHLLDFDAIRLVAGADAPSPLALDAAMSDPGGIYHPGSAAEVRVTALNAPADARVAYEVTDAFSNAVARGSAPVGAIVVPTSRRGWFEVRLSIAGQDACVSYVVVEPPDLRPAPDSPFGCHAFEGDRYRYTGSRYYFAAAEEKMRRAHLAGARKARYHRVSWQVREGRRGEYLWSGLDEAVARAERYGLEPLFNIFGVPQWASAAPDETALTRSGFPRYFAFPPSEAALADWGRYVATVATRYRGRVRKFEFGNEPNYHSVFWQDGDPKSFARYLKTAYDAVKAVDPSVTVYPGAPMRTEFHREVCEALGTNRAYDVLSGHYLGGVGRFGSKVPDWLRLNARMGYGRAMINSEDMDWSGCRRDGRLAMGAACVRQHVHDFRQGISCVYGFQMFATGGEGYFYDCRGNPDPAVAIYRTMTDRLERAKYVGDLSTRDGEAHVFDREGSPVVVFWSELPVDTSFSFAFGPGTATLYDGFDNPTTVTAGAEGAFDVSATLLPGYLEGGDWTRIRAALAAHTDPFAADAASPAGRNLADMPQGTFTGRVFRIAAKDVRVHYGERYVLSCEVRGNGTIDGIVKLTDADGKQVYPARQGLNCLEGVARGDSWIPVTQTFTVRERSADRLLLLLVPNFDPALSNATTEVRNAVVARIDEKTTVAKALFRADAAKGARTGKSDCGIVGGVRAEWNRENLRLAFAVRGPGRPPVLTFAVDPRNDTRDATVFTVVRGAVEKLRNCQTPELPENLTLRGRVAAASVKTARTGDVWRIDVTLPIREIYPFEPASDELAFDFRVGDGCLSAGWAGGIRADSSADPSEFGVLERLRPHAPSAHVISK